MAYNANQRVGEYKKSHKKRSVWKRMVAVLGCAVVFCTTYALILPAITQEYTAHCGLEEHTHSVENGCYEKVLICGYNETGTETGGSAGAGVEAGTGHVHTDACYEEQQVLTCGLEESTGHVHDDSCTQTEQQMVCNEEHTHSDACYETVTTTVCGKTEGEGAHTHSESCYGTQRVLICGLSEETAESSGEAHVHTDACYEWRLTCQKTEHTHVTACFSNPEADVETAADWEKTFEKVELTGYYAEDLLAIAETQIGYKESTENYQVMEDGETIKGYTRYGAWYGMPYEDWCAMFISFCMNYAKVSTDDFPIDAGCQSWVEALSNEKYNLYVPAKDGYIPAPGDLIFFDDTNGAASGDGKADHVGIVSKLIYDEETQNAIDEAAKDTENPEALTAVLASAIPEKIETIEGNFSDQVQKGTCDFASADIMGYGCLPLGSWKSLTSEGEDYTITVRYTPEAQLPAGAELRVSEYAPDSEIYQQRYAEAAQLYGWTEEETAPQSAEAGIIENGEESSNPADGTTPVSYPNGFRLFNVGFYVGDTEVEPAAPVKVSVTYSQEAASPLSVPQDYQVTHFGQEVTETVQSSTSTDDAGQTVDFALESFSDIGIMPLAAGDEATATSYTTADGTIYIPTTVIEEDRPYAILGSDLINAVTKDPSTLMVTPNNGDEAISSGLATAVIGSDGLTGDEIAQYCYWYFEIAVDDQGYNGYKIYSKDENGSKTYLRLTGITQPLNDGTITIMNVLALDANQNNATVFFQDGQRLKAPYKNSWFLGMCVDGIRSYDSTINEYTTNDADSAKTKSFTGYTTQNFTNTILNLYTKTTTVKTVSPSSSVINVFDYWLVDENGNKIPNEGDGESGINTKKYLRFRTDDLISYNRINDYTGNYTDESGSYAGKGAYQGIVENTLGGDGYPVLNKTTAGTSDSQSLGYLFDPGSTDGNTQYRTTVRNAQGLLQLDNEGYYVYDCTQNYACLEQNEDGSFSNQFILYDQPWIKSSAGRNYGQFYPFNSLTDLLKNNVVNDNNGQSLNHYFGATVTARFIQKYDGYTDNGKDRAMTFEFSGDDDVWIFIDDVLVADLGGIHDKVSVKIDFSKGTVTVDPVATVENNNGSITFDKSDPTAKTTTLKQAYIKASRYIADEWATVTVENSEYETYKNNSTHTLKFFYLERGAGASNMYLKYNLTEIPATSIYKVNQYGDALGGASFAVYAAEVEGDEDTGTWKYLTDKGSKTGAEIPQNVSDDDVQYDKVTWDMTYGEQTFKALYYGTTNSQGEMVFLDADGMPYSLSELEKMFGTHFILREVSVPEGYRTVSDDTYLYIEGGLLQTADPYGTGVWASPNAMITATNTLYVADTSKTLAASLVMENGPVQENDTDGYTIDYYNPNTGSNGTLFAVVLKRNEQDEKAGTLADLNLSTWSPVYGNDDKGYEVLTPGEGGNLPQAIEAAKKNAGEPYNQNVIFSVAASGMQLLMENLPGKPERYYSYVYNNNVIVNASEPQYVVAYYWTTQDISSQADWDNVNTTNTVRVASHENTTPDGDTGFDVQWGSTIQVPNVLNRLFFQKKKEDGTLVGDAVFALYNVEEHAIKDAPETQDKLIYYIGHGATADDTAKYWVALLDSDGSAAKAGKAAVFREKEDETAEIVGYGTYTINTRGWSAITEGDHAGRVSGTNIGQITVTVTHSDSGYTTTIDDTNKVTVYVDPAKDVHDDYPLVGYTHNSCSVVNEDGTGHLSYLGEGCYYLREIAAPVGYALNTTAVPVFIDSTGVYANAGTSKDNGVAVGNGVGYLVATMNTFASKGKIDESLTWVYGALIVNRATDFSAFANDTGDTLTVSGTEWNFATQEAGDKRSHASGIVDSTDSTDRSNAMVTYLEYTGDQPNTPEDIFDYSPNADQSPRTTVEDSAGTTVTPTAWVSTIEGQGDRWLYTTVGWSDMAIYQDYAYGYKQITTGNSTNYDDLTGQGNLANLFSSSTFVEVTDPSYVDLQLIKTESGTNKELTGAEFRLRKDVTTQAATTDENGTTVNVEKVTSYYYHRAANETTWVTDAAQATIIYPGDNEKPNIFYDLPSGVYVLEEYKAPDGYHPLTGTISITVTDPTSTKGVLIDADETGAVLSSEVTMVDGNHTIVTGVTTGQGLHYQYTLTVPNSMGYELPHTGGSGTLALTLLGLTLATVGCCGLYGWRKRGGAA